MLLVRQLLYKEKILDDFDIDSDLSIFKKFFEVLITIDGTTENDNYVEKNITDMFNDACYICTVSLLVKRPALRLGYFRNICNKKDASNTYYSEYADRADIVFCLVYYLLKNSWELNEATKKLMEVIDNNLRNNSHESNELYERFFHACDPFQGFIPPGYFNPITIDSDMLKGLDISWKEITGGFDKSKLEELVCFWKEPRQRNLIIDDIESEVNNTIFEEELPF